MFNPLHRPVACLLIVAAIVRVAVLWGGFDQLRDDPDAYNTIGRTLAQTGTFGVGEADGIALPTAFRPPLYPAMLAVIHGAIIATGGEMGDPLTGGNPFPSQIAIAALHVLLSLATIVMTFFVAVRLLSVIPPPATRSLSEKGAGPLRRGQKTSKIDSPPKGHTPFRIGSQTPVNRCEGRDPNLGVAMLASLLVIADPILLQGSVLVMTETLATLLAITAMHLWLCLMDRLMRSDGVTDSTQPQREYFCLASGLGAALGLAYLCRPTFIVWTFLLVVYLVGWAGLERLRSRWLRPGTVTFVPPRWHRLGSQPLAAAGTIALAAAVFLAGWTLRNYQQLGHPVWATTHGGYTLLLGNNPSFFQYMRTGQLGMAWDPEDFFNRWEARELADPRKSDFWKQPIPSVADPAWQAERLAVRQQTKAAEMVDDRLAYETARAAIDNDFNGFVQATLWRIGRLLSPMPQTPSGGGHRMRLAIIAVTVFYMVTLGLAIWGLLILGIRIFHPPWAGAMLLILSLLAVHAFYWTNMRMRAPAIPVLAVLVVIPLQRLPSIGRVHPGAQRPSVSL